MMDQIVFLYWGCVADGRVWQCVAGGRERPRMKSWLIGKIEMELTTLTRNREIECGLKYDIKKEKEGRILNKEKEKRV